ncbi:hypothetical protein Rsub_02448 [Raphidocelis subcapitata]|uniref:Beta-catenin-like protein 1 N-terminal domain-containing protein n=1 Tax=Raphidocelis subcapitata TaxID=307507 RepID=A0A2V0NUI6_9CHLO|nr:hypothetical protein Rsub_02448 [Raphidocelis subcapitata]|eukprot:GBF90342.1 hypothetical protein Rsub_02448 [Raphidocelis subcapitata]
MDGPGGQRRGGGATAEPVAVLEAAIQKMVQDAKSKALAKAAGGGAPAAPFVAAKAFQGRRPGYLFTTRSMGTGYYLDPLQPPPSADGEEGGDGGAAAPQRAAAAPLDGDELLRRAEEEANIDEVQALDARSLRRLAAQLDKKARENLELRAKYAGEPLKFLDNEVDLLSLVREVGQVAGSPELYPVLIDGPALPALLGLLSHDNADIVAEAVDLLQELTDADAVEDSAEEAQALVAALLEANGLELLFQALTRFDESNEEEAAGVNKALATFEHLAEISPPAADAAFARTGLLKWLLARVRRKGSDSNRLYASELLAILLQGREENQRRLGAADGIDALLMAISPYKSRDPQDAEEEEYLENVFDALCCCIMLPDNRAAFVAAEGIELMYLLLKAKRASRYGAVKALDFACTRCPPAADRLVEVGGLAPLFALFMGRAKVKGPKGEKTGRDVAQEMEERAVSLVSSLLQHVTKAALRDRVAAKFVEAEFEKTDMLVEIMFKYEDRVAAAEARLAPQFEAGDLDEDDVVAEQLDAGLFTLQGCVVIAAALWAAGDPGLRKRLLALLHQRGRSLDMIREYLYEYYVSLGDDDGAAAAAAAAAAGGAKPGKLPADSAGARQRKRLAAFMEGVEVDAAAAEEERRRRQGKATDDAGAADAGAGGAPPEAPADAAGDGAGGGDGDGGGGGGGGGGGDVDMEVEDLAGDAGGGGGGGGKERENGAPAAAEAGRPSEPARGSGGGGGGSGEREREPARRDRSRSRERRRERSSSRDRERGRDRERERERERGRERRHSRSRSRSRDRDRRRRSRSRSGERGARRGARPSRARLAKARGIVLKLSRDNPGTAAQLAACKEKFEATQQELHAALDSTAVLKQQLAERSAAADGGCPKPPPKAAASSDAGPARSSSSYKRGKPEGKGVRPAAKPAPPVTYKQALMGPATKGVVSGAPSFKGVTPSDLREGSRHVSRGSSCGPAAKSSRTSSSSDGGGAPPARRAIRSVGGPASQGPPAWGQGVQHQQKGWQLRWCGGLTCSGDK